ncbi:MAG: hypothetical protein HC921_22100 [Synechococcaceae cyanobacterium SM2_3_1]|nr:hypothetical protein [Synechococcaceae cyanobacterium SM2_3_1]
MTWITRSDPNGSGLVADLQLRNLGDPVTNWELSWAFPVDEVEITNLWNGQLAQNGSEVKVTNLDWNATLDHQEQMDLGFEATYTEGGVTPTEFRLNGLLCNGLPASPIPTPNPGGSPQPSPDPNGSPQPSPGSSPTPPVEIPTNALIITNADEVDGTPLQVGQSLTLTAVAGDQQGQDISAQIQWVDQAGTVRGTGPVLMYEADQVVMETLTAKVGSQTAKVSFSVSEPGYILGAHVKGLSDETVVLRRNWLERVLELKEDGNLPSIQVGDILVGARFKVPPMKVIQIDPQPEKLVLEVEPAEVGEVIIEGDFPPELWQMQVIDLEGNVVGQVGAEGESTSLIEVVPEGGCSVFGIPILPAQWPAGDPYEFEILPEESFSGEIVISEEQQWSEFFKQENIQYSGQSFLNGYIQGGLCPVFANPHIKFEGGELKQFEIENGIKDQFVELYAKGKVEGQILTEFNNQGNPIIIPVPLPERLQVGVITAGPLPVGIYIGFTDLQISLSVSPFLEAQATLEKLGLRYEQSNLLVRMGYSSEQGWNTSYENSPPQIIPLWEGINGLITGTLRAKVRPEIGFGIWADVLPIEAIEFPGVPWFNLDDPLDVGLILPSVGVEITGEAVLQLSDEQKVTISSFDEGESYSGSEPLELVAHMGLEDPPTLEFFGGLDITIGGGELNNECQCVGDSCPTSPSTGFFVGSETSLGFVEIPDSTLSSDKSISLVNYPCPPILLNNDQPLNNALSSFRGIHYCIDGYNFLVDKRGLKHVFSHHHPAYYTDPPNPNQARHSFFIGSQTIDEIIDMIDTGIKSNRDEMIRIGKQQDGAGQFTFTASDGKAYRIGFFNYRLGQFFPLEQPGICTIFGGSTP